MIHYYTNVRSLNDFKNGKEQVGILRRKTPKNIDTFFKKFYKTPLSISGHINRISAKKDINELLKRTVSNDIKFDPFYENWLEDMSEICKFFCSFQGQEQISFWLGSDRGCKRYHVDMVPFRLLVTYAGKGTEILPDKAANRNAFIEGKQNNKIIKDKLALQFSNIWDISIFRGGPRGILHRTPDAALNSNSSILMRLDDSSFIDKIIKFNHT